MKLFTGGRRKMMKRDKTEPLWTRNFVLLGIANFLMFTAFYFLIPILPVYIENVLKGDKGTIGMIMAAYTLAALLIRPITGVVIDGKGRRRIYMFSMFFFALFFNGYIVASSVLLLLINRFIHGFTWGITTTTGNTLAVDIIPDTRRGEGISYFGLSVTIAMSVGPLLGMTLLQGSHYTLVFLSSSTLALAAWILTLVVQYPAYTAPHNTGKINLTKGLLEKRAIPVSLAIMVLNITYGGLLTFVALYAKEIGVENPGMFFLFYALGIFLSRMATGKIFDHHGPPYLVAVATVVLAAGFFLLATWRTIPGFFTSAFILGFGGGVIFPTFQAMINNLIEPHRRGAANSTLFTALDIGIGLGMIILGLLSEIIGLSSAFLICSFIILCVIIMFFAWVLPHYYKHKIPLIIPQD